jgi:hypothetical protein
VAVFISLPLVSAEAGEASFLYAPDQLRALPFLGKKTFDGGGGEIEKREKKKKSCPSPDRFSASAACGWLVFELPLFFGLCHRAATGLHRGVLLPRRTMER